MGPDPGAIFGGLMRGCISDSYLKKDKGVILESALSLILGIASSIVTTYVLAAVGLLV